MRPALFCFVLLCGCHEATPIECDAADAGLVDDGTWDGGPTSVPMTVGTQPNGAFRFSVPVEVGGTTIQALLDTGSSGLRILPGAVPESAFDTIGTTKLVYAYQSGVEITGRVAFARVGFGDRATSGPIAVMHIDDVSCANPTESCERDGNDENAFDGFSAILGTGMRNAHTPCGPPVGDPIAQLPGRPTFIVDAPPFGQSTGELVIDPDAADLAAFQLFQLDEVETRPQLADGTPAWDDAALPTCVLDAQAGLDLCAGGILDSGNPSMLIDWRPYLGDEQSAPPSSTVDVRLGPARAPLVQYSIVVSSPVTQAFDNVDIEPSVRADSQINLGTLAFFRNRVAFDHAHGVIALQPR